MMNLHQEALYIPFNDTHDDMPRVGYVIAPTAHICRKLFVASMGTGATWQALKKKGWRIVPCEIIGDEREIYPKEFDQ